MKPKVAIGFHPKQWPIRDFQFSSAEMVEEFLKPPQTQTDGFPEHLYRLPLCTQFEPTSVKSAACGPSGGSCTGQNDPLLRFFPLTLEVFTQKALKDGASAAKF